MEKLPFLNEEQVLAIQREFGTPVYVYDEQTLEARARAALAFKSAYGHRVRYAMKALSTAAILRLFHRLGIHIDASSGYEAERAMLAGVPPQNIQITAQELPTDLKGLAEKGVLFNACSLRQLEAYGELFPGTEVSVRINPGLGSGHSNRCNTGGPGASFGIWHEFLGEVFAVAKLHGLKLTRMHTHIGSGSDPALWDKCARMALDIAAKMPEVTALSLGGGFKVGRMEGEVSADMAAIGEAIAKDVEAFKAEHGRELFIEIEPGTFLVANGGMLIASVTDVVSTGADGYTFIKTDSGMTEVLRPSIYGAQHPLVVVPADGESRGVKDYIVAGHCCESGDILTPAPDDPEGLLPRTLTEAKVGDPLVVGGAGAYCSSMSPKNYNSFPAAAEVLVQADGTPKLIRKRQTLEQIIENEVS